MNKFKIKVKNNIIHSIRDKDIIFHFKYKIFERLINFNIFGIKIRKK
jgi:polyphosphate kinase